MRSRISQRRRRHDHDARLVELLTDEERIGTVLMLESRVWGPPCLYTILFPGSYTIETQDEIANRVHHCKDSSM